MSSSLPLDTDLHGYRSLPSNKQDITAGLHSVMDERLSSQLERYASQVASSAGIIAKYLKSLKDDPLMLPSQTTLPTTIGAAKLELEEAAIQLLHLTRDPGDVLTNLTVDVRISFPTLASFPWRCANAYGWLADITVNVWFHFPAPIYLCRAMVIPLQDSHFCATGGHDLIPRAVPHGKRATKALAQLPKARHDRSLVPRVRNNGNGWPQPCVAQASR